MTCAFRHHKAFSSVCVVQTQNTMFLGQFYLCLNVRGGTGLVDWRTLYNKVNGRNKRYSLQESAAEPSMACGSQWQGRGRGHGWEVIFQSLLGVRWLAD
jgi:hypothetical protein